MKCLKLVKLIHIISNLIEEKSSGQFDVKAQYGKGKVTTVSLEGVSSDKEVNLKIETNSPHSDKIKKFELELNTKVHKNVIISLTFAFIP